MATITNVLGETREVTGTWENGAYECPFCYYTVQPLSVCCNPACTANPNCSVDWARAQQAKAQAEADETAKRESIAAWRAQAYIDAQVAKDEIKALRVAEAIDRGCCVICATSEYGKPKWIKHRNGHKA